MHDVVHMSVANLTQTLSIILDKEVLVMTNPRVVGIAILMMGSAWI